MVAIYADGSSLEQMEKLAADPRIEGFTTNPSLMKKAGITNYRDFSKAVLNVVNGKPVSFEVLADDFNTMESQAREIASWGRNVWVKIPVTNTLGHSSTPLIKSLIDLQLNVTAVMTQEQIWGLSDVLQEQHILSVFVGRITDTDAWTPSVRRPRKCKALWASTRTINSAYTAGYLSFDIITLTADLIAKLELRGKDLAQYSLETVQQFHNDGKGITF